MPFNTVELSRSSTRDIAKIANAHCGMWVSAVITTNYDKLLEKAYTTLRDGLPRTPTHRDTDMLGSLLFNGDFFILKAHGDIDRPESLVLTIRDYRELIHSNPAFDAIFSAILLTKAIFFVGYSINDPDFRLLLDRQLSTFKGNVPERYALMSGVGDIEREVLWRTAKIRVLPYNEHYEVLTFLEALRDDLIRFTARGPILELLPKKDSFDEKIESLAKVDPRSAVVEAAYQVEREIDLALGRLNLTPSRIGTYKDVNVFLANNYIDGETAKVWREIRELRNRAIHGHEEITYDEANDYAQLAKRLIQTFASLQK